MQQDPGPRALLGGRVSQGQHPGTGAVPHLCQGQHAQGDRVRTDMALDGHAWWPHASGCKWLAQPAGTARALPLELEGAQQRPPQLSPSPSGPLSTQDKAGEGPCATTMSPLAVPSTTCSTLRYPPAAATPPASVAEGAAAPPDEAAAATTAAAQAGPTHTLWHGAEPWGKRNAPPAVAQACIAHAVPGAAAVAQLEGVLQPPPLLLPQTEQPHPLQKPQHHEESGVRAGGQGGTREQRKRARGEAMGFTEGDAGAGQVIRDEDAVGGQGRMPDGALEDEEAGQDGSSEAGRRGVGGKQRKAAKTK